jgi:hypothetical protein
VGAHVQVRTRVHRRPVPDYVIVDELQVERESVQFTAEREMLAGRVLNEKLGVGELPVL